VSLSPLSFSPSKPYKYLHALVLHLSPPSTSSFRIKLQPGLKLQTTLCNNQPIRAMASGQQFKGDRAEAAAKLAAKDIGDMNRANERDENFDLHNEANFKQARAEAAAKLAAKDLEDVNRMRDHTATSFKEQQGENRPGVIGSMFRAAKEAVVGKPHDVVETSPRGYGYDSSRDRVTNEQGGSKMGEYADYATQKAKETKDATMQKAGEYTDFATQKAKEGKDYAADRAKEAKDATAQKAAEYRDYTAEKAKEVKDSGAGKLGELKDSAADAAKRAMGFFTGPKDETKVNFNFQHLFCLFVHFFTIYLLLVP